MRTFLIVITLGVALFLEWVLGVWDFSGGMRPPIAAAVFIFWCWRLTPQARLRLGLFLGIVADSTSFLPFGTHMLAFLLIVILMRAFQLFFSNVESFLTEGVGMATLLFLYMEAVSPIAMALGGLRGAPYGFEPASFLSLSLAALVWALVFSAALLGLSYSISLRRRPL